MFLKASHSWITMPGVRHFSFWQDLVFISHCGCSVHPGFKAFNEEIIPYLVVYLSFLWEEVSSRSSYAAVLKPLLLLVFLV